MLAVGAVPNICKIRSKKPITLTKRVLSGPASFSAATSGYGEPAACLCAALQSRRRTGPALLGCLVRGETRERADSMSVTGLPIPAVLEHVSSAIYWPLPLALWPIPMAIPFWAIFLWARMRERQILSRSQPLNDAATGLDKGSWPLINHGWR